MYIPIDSGLDSPIYKQIADAINRNIVSGRLARGAKLPTVRELADRLGIARGTIKRAYDELARLGRVEMKQGQGTFVIYDKPSMDSRKERAMAVIDGLLSELEELNFTTAEMSIFFELKLRERMQLRDDLLVVAAGPSPELLFTMSEQLYSLGGVEVYKQLIDGKSADAESLLSGADLVVAPAGSVRSSDGKLTEAAVGIDPDTAAGFARLRKADTAAVITVSGSFNDETLKLLHRYAPDVHAVSHIPDAEPSDAAAGALAAVLERCTAVIVPDGAAALFPAYAVTALNGCGLPLLRCRIRMDEGTMLSIRMAADRARERRRTAPGRTR